MPAATEPYHRIAFLYYILFGAGAIMFFLFFRALCLVISYTAACIMRYMPGIPRLNG